MSLTINVSREQLLPALNSVQNVTGKKGTMAILANVLIRTQDNHIEIMATDLEVGIREYVPAEIIVPGSITLPAKLFHDIVRGAASDKLKLEERENNWVKIKAGTSVFNLAGTSSEEYPEFPAYQEDSLARLPSSLVKELIDKTIFSVAQDRESNFTLTGILLEQIDEEGKKYIRMVSSDGHRLSVMEKEATAEMQNLSIDNNIIIPKKGINEIKKICESNQGIELGHDSKQLIIKTDNTLLVIKLMNGEFPDYKNIINVISKDNYFEVDRYLFLDSLKRTNIFTEDNFNAIQIILKNENMVLKSHNLDFGNSTDELSVNYQGEELDLGFNCKYFIDVLQVMESDIVKVYINSEQSPCLLEGDNDNGFLSIIMPMKI